MPVESKNQPRIAKRSRRLPKWQVGGTDFGIFLALLFSSMVVVSSVARNLALWALDLDPGDEQPLLILLSENLGMQLGMLTAFVTFHLVTRFNNGRSTRKSPALEQSIKTGLKWLLIAYPIMIGVNLLWKTGLETLGFERITQDPVRLVQEGGTRLEVALIYLMIVIVAPLCEELVFRGAIFRFLHHRVPLVTSVGVSALLFALIHFNLYSFAPLFVIGVTLALAYRESGSILSAIVFHSVFNTINLLIIIVFPDVQ